MNSLIPIYSLNSCNGSLFAGTIGLLTLYKSQVHCFGVMHWWNCSSLESAPCLQRQVAEICERIVLLLGFITQQLHGKIGKIEIHFKFRYNVANLAVFPRIWACVFVELRVCLKTYGLLVIGLVLIEICLFFGLVFRRFLITDFWLFFKFTCLFLQHNLASLI